MIPTCFVRLLSIIIIMICLSVAAAALAAQAANPEYEPKVGPGKDVGWLPTEQAVVELMLDMAKVTLKDYVIDLGSGDGRTVITAAKRGARALGIEYNPDLVAFSKRNAAREGVSDKVEFIQADLFEVDFSRATVVTLFLRNDLNLKLRPRILDMKPGVRVVSNSFNMEEWTPDETASVEEERCANLCCTAYFWIVPAKVEGTWKLAQGELRLRQSFQMISGTLSSGATIVPVVGRLRGSEIIFTAGADQYIGRADGNAMEGQVLSGGSTAKWNATRM
jgi:precorrin-6B methylase 2